MNLREIMTYIASEYEIINLTPCEVCGGEFFADGLQISLIDGKPFDVCECICSNCGHERNFAFFAPFVEPNQKEFKHNLH